MSESTTITFTKEKSTKNTVRFTEDEKEGQAPVVGSLYVQKWFAGDAEKFEVTLTKK